MADVLEGIALRLAAAGIALYEATGVYPADSTQPVIVEQAVIPTPDQLVILSLYPGPEGDGEPSRNPWTDPRLQVRVRSTRDPRIGNRLQRDIRNNLHAIGRTTLPNGVRLTDCHSLQSVPMPMGQDANGRWESTRNYQLTIS